MERAGEGQGEGEERVGARAKERERETERRACTPERHKSVPAVFESRRQKRKKRRVPKLAGKPPGEKEQEKVDKKKRKGKEKKRKEVEEKKKKRKEKENRQRCVAPVNGERKGKEPMKRRRLNEEGKFEEGTQRGKGEPRYLKKSV